MNSINPFLIPTQQKGLRVSLPHTPPPHTHTQTHWSDDGLACIAFLCSPRSSLLLRMYEPFCQNTGVTSNNYLYKQKYWTFWNIVTTYMWGCLPCTYCPNLSSKFHHLNPKQPSHSLPFLQIGHRTLFQKSRLMWLRNTGYGEITAISEKSVLWPIHNGGMADY